MSSLKPTHSIQVRAFAKINLGLSVFGKRADGYHEIHTIYQTVALHDRLEIQLQTRRGAGSRAANAGDIRVVCDDPTVPSGRQNLVYRACSLWKRARAFREANTHDAEDYETFKRIMQEQRGFIRAYWCGSAECEARIKEETRATIRVIPEDAEHTMRRRKHRQGFGGRLHVRSVAPCDVIAAKDDHVGTFVAQLERSSSYVLGRHPSAAVDICEKTDAKSFERGRQAGDLRRGPLR